MAGVWVWTWARAAAGKINDRVSAALVNALGAMDSTMDTP